MIFLSAAWGLARPLKKLQPFDHCEERLLWQRASSLRFENEADNTRDLSGRRLEACYHKEVANCIGNAEFLPDVSR